MDRQIDLEDLNRKVNHNYFNAWLGLKVVEAGHGEVVMHLPWRQEIESNRDGNFIHGGILGTLVDTAAAFAIRTVIENAVRTIDMRADYHAPAMGDLTVRARTLKVGRTIATADCRIHNAGGELAASGRAAFIVLDPARRPRQ